MFSNGFSSQDTAASENMCGNPSSCNSCSMLGNPSLMSLPGPPTILRAAWCLHHSFYSAALCSALLRSKQTLESKLLPAAASGKSFGKLYHSNLSILQTIPEPERLVRTFFSISVFMQYSILREKKYISYFSLRILD